MEPKAKKQKIVPMVLQPLQMPVVVFTVSNELNETFAVHSVEEAQAQIAAWVAAGFDNVTITRTAPAPLTADTDELSTILSVFLPAGGQHPTVNAVKNSRGGKSKLKRKRAQPPSDNSSVPSLEIAVLDDEFNDGLFKNPAPTYFSALISPEQRKSCDFNLNDVCNTLCPGDKVAHRWLTNKSRGRLPDHA